MNTFQLLGKISLLFITDNKYNVRFGPITSHCKQVAKLGDDPILSERKITIKGQSFLIQVHKIEG